jgi:hypothetical protein
MSKFDIMQNPSLGIAVGGVVCLALVVIGYRVGKPSWHSAASDSSHQVEGLKALADWTKWIVSLQTAVVGGIVIAILKGEIGASGGSITLLVAAAVCLVVSIIAATMLMGQIPPAIERAPIRQSASEAFDMYSFPHHLWPFDKLGVQIRHLAGAVHTCFIAGVLFGLAGFVWPKGA